MTLNAANLAEAVTVAVAEPMVQVVRVGGNVQGFLGGVVGGVPGGASEGVIGGIVGAVPAAAPQALRRQFDAGRLNSPVKAIKEKDAGELAARVRSYFPDALYINPEIITDSSGAATIAIRTADSITTWRMAMMASTVRGALGSGSSSVKVFRDFFTDLDLPVTLTRATAFRFLWLYTTTRGREAS